MIEFNKWPKIKRLENEVCTITEKIDGTNGQIYIDENDTIYVGARNSWITVEKDNHGFAAWIEHRREHILEVLPRHKRIYGEFFGKGINRGYGLGWNKFAIFNQDLDLKTLVQDGFMKVPVLASHTIIQDIDDSVFIGGWTRYLDEVGSIAVPGYRNPEGIIIQLHETGARLKAFCRGNKDK